MSRLSEAARTHALRRACTNCTLPFVTDALADATLCPSCLAAGDREPFCEDCGQPSGERVCPSCLANYEGEDQ